MSAPATIIPVILGNTTLPQVNWASIPNLPEFEADFDDHWIFDKGGAANLIGGLAGTALTPVATAPTHGANSMTFANGGMHGVRSVFPDAQVSTLFGVFRRQAVPADSVAFPLMGSMSMVAAEGGSQMLDQIGPSIQGRTRQAAAAAQIANSGSTAIPVNAAYFIAMVNNNGEATYYAGGIGHTTQSQAKTLSTRTYGLGNAYMNNVGYFNGAITSEFAVKVGVAKTVAQLSDIYARSKVRMQRRGITLV